MHSRVLRLLPITPLDFGQATISSDLPLFMVQGVDLTWVCSGMLEVIVHEMSVASTNEIQIGFAQQAKTADDPSKLFLGDIIAIIALTSGSDMTGKVVAAAFDKTKLSGQGALVIVGKSNGSSAASATVSVQVTLRGCS